MGQQCFLKYAIPFVLYIIRLLTFRKLHILNIKEERGHLFCFLFYHINALLHHHLSRTLIGADDVHTLLEPLKSAPVDGEDSGSLFISIDWTNGG